MEGFTEALSFELASQNISAKIVVPHGGISDNNFMARTTQEWVAGSEDVQAAYSDFNKHIGAAWGRMVAGIKTNSDQVAEVIYNAATDGSDRLRYWIGDDARGFVVNRYGQDGDTADQAYMAKMREYFV